MNRTVPKIHESVEELKLLLRKVTEAHEKQRLSMLYLGQSGQAKNRKQVAELLGLHRTTIGNWLSCYEAGGLEKLLERRYPPGCVPALTEEQQTSLRTELQKPEGFRSYKEIQQYIADTFGVNMKYSAVYALVHGKWKAKLKVPRKSHKKNAEESEAFRENFQQEVADAIDEKQSDYSNIRLFSQDETRYGLLPVANRRITLSGIKPVAEIEYSFTSMSLYGAVDPQNGDHFFLEFPHLNADCFQIFINQFSTQFSESLNVMVLDNGRFHQAKKLEIPDNVILLFLPPYSPELNPIERLWQDLKAKLFCQADDTIEAMQKKITEIIHAYSTTTIAKITGFSFFVKTDNVI